MHASPFDRGSDYARFTYHSPLASPTEDCPYQDQPQRADWMAGYAEQTLREQAAERAFIRYEFPSYS